MSVLFEAASDLQAFLDAGGWKFCLIGGLAVLRWGQPRLTRDLDVTLLCPFGAEELPSGALLEAGYKGRIADAREFARRSRVLLIESPRGIPIDVAFGALPFEEGMIERSSLFEFEPGICLRTCSAEDLMVLKLFAFRTRDVADAEGIAVRQHSRLDWATIAANLAPLAEVKDEPGILATLERLRRQR